MSYFQLYLCTFQFFRFVSEFLEVYQPVFMILTVSSLILICGVLLFIQIEIVQYSLISDQNQNNSKYFLPQSLWKKMIDCAGLTNSFETSIDEKKSMTSYKITVQSPIARQSIFCTRSRILSITITFSKCSSLSTDRTKCVGVASRSALRIIWIRYNFRDL